MKAIAELGDWEDASSLMEAHTKKFVKALGVKKAAKRVEGVVVRNAQVPPRKDGGRSSARIIGFRLRIRDERLISKVEALGHFTDEEFDEGEVPDFFVVRKCAESSNDVLYELNNGGFLAIEFASEDDPRHAYVTLYRDEAAASEEYPSRILR